jgi:MFS family permease
VCGVKGQPFGTVVAMSCSGLIAASAGWPWVFYATGALGLFTSALWILLAADSPALHKLTSPQERNYIEKSIGVQGTTSAQDADKVGGNDRVNS